MNALQQFEKDHPVLIHVYLVFVIQAVVTGGYAAAQYLVDPANYPVLSVLKLAAGVFLATLIQSVFTYLKGNTNTNISELSSVLEPIIEKQVQELLKKIPPLPGTPVTNQQNIQAQTYTSTPVGNQIASGLVIPADFTWQPTTPGPIMFPVPTKSPVQQGSAFHDLLGTTPVPVTPPQPQLPGWLDSTKDAGK